MSAFDEQSRPGGRGDEPTGQRPSGDRPGGERPSGDRPAGERSPTSRGGERRLRVRSAPRRRGAARTLWSLAVLGLLRERDMHPYEMQRQLHLRHTDELLALKRGSLYHAINQLQRDGLIEPVETSREGRWPERTVYRITPEGEEEMLAWLGDLIATPVREPSQFMAALAHVQQLTPREALDQLQLRVISLEATVAGLRAVHRGVAALIGRGAVIEVEYATALLEAELAWVNATIDDLRSGKLNWDFEKMKQGINIDHEEIQKVLREGGLA